MTMRELRYIYLTTKNPLEKDLIGLYAPYLKKERHYSSLDIEALREAWKASKGIDKDLITWIGKKKTATT